MIVLNSSDVRTSLRLEYGAIAQFPPGKSNHIYDRRIESYVNSHPDLSIVEEEVVKPENKKKATKKSVKKPVKKPDEEGEKLAEIVSNLEEEK